MLFSTPLQLLVLCAVAVFAWLLGFATNPTTVNRTAAIRRLTREFTSFRAQAQGHLNNLARHTKALEDGHRDLTDRLKATEAKLAGAVSPQPEPVEPVESDARPEEDAPAPTGTPIAPEPASGWLGSGRRDDLTRIDGIDTDIDARLYDLDITRFEDIEKLSDQDEMALELRLELPAGYTTARQWRVQAALLREGKVEEFATRFGVPPIDHG